MGVGTREWAGAQWEKLLPLSRPLLWGDWETEVLALSRGPDNLSPPLWPQFPHLLGAGKGKIVERKQTGKLTCFQ